MPGACTCTADFVTIASPTFFSFTPLTICGSFEGGTAADTICVVRAEVHDHRQLALGGGADHKGDLAAVPDIPVPLGPADAVAVGHFSLNQCLFLLAQLGRDALAVKRDAKPAGGLRNTVSARSLELKGQ